MNGYRWFFLSVLILLAFFVQITIFLNFDVTYLTHAAVSLMNGGTYTRSFFETNPPLIFFLYMPPLLFSQHAGISLSVAMRIYFFTAAIISLGICDFLLKKILKKNDLLEYIILLTLVFILFFLPMHQMGQREYVMMLFIFPYLFVTMLRVEDKCVGPYFAWGVGLFAGMGIALKPFFLTVPLFVELYLIYKKRHLTSIFRIENCVMASFFILYLLFILEFFPDYIHTILPFVDRVYFVGMKKTWTAYFHNLSVLYCFAAAIFYGITRKIDRYPTLTTICFLALLGFIISFTIPRALFLYHLLPALSLACLLFAILLGQIILDAFQALRHQSLLVKMREMFLFIFMTFIVFAIPISIDLYIFFSILEIKQEKPIRELITFFQQHVPHNTFVCFSISSDYTLVEYYSGAKYVGPAAFFWWEYGFRRLEKTLKNPSALTQLKKDRQLANNVVINNLIEKKPDFVLIDIRAGKLYLNTDIDYLADLSRSPAFRQAWHHYHYVNTIGRFKIFERDKN